MATILILLSVICSSVAHLLMKIGAKGLVFTNAGANLATLRQALSPALMGGITLHVVALVLWIAALTKVEISYAYPFISLGYVLVTVAAYFLLNEAVTPMRLLGLAIIVAGVLVIAKS